MTRPAGIAALLAVLAAWPCLVVAQTAARQKAPDGAQVYFHYPLDGLRVPERFTVRIGLRGMGVAPAGVDHARTGHHHLLIDTDPANATNALP